jgi:radical SAM superfamily enzyme YgiQ (UPF0313 family)
VKITVILAINAKYVHSSLSAWSLYSGVSRYARHSHDVRVVETTINNPDDEIISLVVAHKPDVVGVSTYIWNAGRLPSILKRLRELMPEALFVLGGPEASYNAGYWLKHGADFVLYGEGERSFPAFLDSLDDNLYANGKSDFTGNHNGKSLLTPATEPIDDWFDTYNDNYFSALNGRIAYLETSRGCPYSCAFCLSGRESSMVGDTESISGCRSSAVENQRSLSYGQSPEKAGVRFLHIDAAKELLRKLSKTGSKTVKLVDRTFNCNPDRSYHIFEYIIGLKADCCFHFEVAADLFDARTLSLLKTAPPGLIQFEAGIQSFFEPALKASSRQSNLIKIEQNIRSLLLGRNIHIHVDLIAGLPYEKIGRASCRERVSLCV